MECPAAASTVDRELSARQGAGQTQAEEMQVTRELGFDLTNVAQAALLATLAPSSEHSYAVSGSGAPSGTFASLEPLSLPLASAPTCGERAGALNGLLAGLSPLGLPSPTAAPALGTIVSPGGLLPNLMSPGPLGSPVTQAPPPVTTKSTKSIGRL
eukprot:TRINITY_DN23562_c0_g1_i1.p1 TRINITY_DN23562_c0_g1~~TRINITY_DN23562_c0_g1_i1.p1  ORF type:complete len:165 (+),score=34.35 TRINITY_DN23562_c0_g1_i1:30-497(+)